MVKASGAQGSGSVPAYFVDSKKGEVNELKALLRNQAVERDPNRKRDVIKKVIAYMTLGYDVSRLFGEMVMASSTADIIVKKMCYLYLSNYARSNEELATLCINTMTKDCQDSDPMVRGLALRSLSSLGLESTIEYLLPVLHKGLQDSSAYVRRNAVMAVLKLYQLRPELVKDGDDGDNDFVDMLYNMIQDRDSTVTSACLMVLTEVMMEEGGIAINDKLIMHLLNRIREFTEWGQCLVLDLCAKYRPKTREETFAIMNILDGELKVANSAVVLGTTKCFLNFAEALHDLKVSIYMRLKQPILTLMTGANRELRYSLLKHIHIMVMRCPGVFDDEFKQFYCHYNEPMHVKFVKLKILPELTNEENVHELVAELSEYVADVNQEMAKAALDAFGRIAVKIPAGADGIINQLLEFINMEIDYVRSGVVCVIKDLLRKYPDRAVDVLPALPRCLRKIEDPIGRTAVIFMLGEYAQKERQTPYLLENLIENYDNENDVEVKTALLTATVKVFFKRAPECVDMLKVLLTNALNDTSDTDLHDRALLYYRLLQHGDIGNVAAKVIGGEKDVVTTFTEERVSGMKQKLFEEFNTLSIIYEKPSDQFVEPKYRESKADKRRNSDENFGLDEVEDSSSKPSSYAHHNVMDQEITTNDNHTDYLDDLLDLNNTVSTTASENAIGDSKWYLISGASVDQNTFQSKWESLPQAAFMDLHLSSSPTVEQLESAAGQHNIMCMASGDLGSEMKFYFFGQDNSLVYYFCEVALTKGDYHFKATIKTDDPEHADEFANVFTSAIAQFL